MPVAGCKPLGRETRKHPPQQVRKLAASLDRFGFVLPILIDAERRVVAGWGLVLAARQLGLSEVPAVSLTDLSEAELRMLRLALNRITDDAAWDREALALEFSEILELDAADRSRDQRLRDGRDRRSSGRPRPRPGRRIAADRRWGHAGDPRGRPLGSWRASPALRRRAATPRATPSVLGADKADMMFADPPYNVPIEGHVSGLGKVKHANFAMASGELSLGASSNPF